MKLLETAPVKSVKPDVLDDHFYLSAEKYFDDIHHFMTTDRNGPKIFMGEYATMEGSPTADFGAALGDAAWLTGVERSSDVVVMSSYAPLMVNVHNGGMRVASGLIEYSNMLFARSLRRALAIGFRPAGLESSEHRSALRWRSRTRRKVEDQTD